MDIGLIAQHVVNGLMLGLIYSLVAVGFTLFFGVLDVIKFSHGDMLTWGVFTGLFRLSGPRTGGPFLPLVYPCGGDAACHGRHRFFGRGHRQGFDYSPQRGAAPQHAFNHSHAGDGAQGVHPPVLSRWSKLQTVPGTALPDWSHSWGQFTLRFDNAVMLTAGILMIMLVQIVIKRTKLGMAIRAVSQDEETARIMGINFNMVVYITFAIGSALAAFAGVIYGLYYNELSFNMGAAPGCHRVFGRGGWRFW